MWRASAIEVDFRWEVSEAGYEWRLGDHSKALLCERNVPHIRRREYQPLLEHPSLFREFAKLEGKDEIRRFADQYGVILGEYAPSDSVRERGRYYSVGSLCGTSLNVWAQESADISCLIDVWDAINACRLGPLRNLISWKKGGAVEYQLVTSRRKAWKLLAPAGAAHAFKEGEILNPAKHILQREINDRLSNEHSGEIYYAPRLLRQSDASLCLILRPRNLLSAMWLQFAQIVGGSYELKECPICHRDFLPTRSDAITCSHACRQKKSRKNRGSSH